MDIRSDIQHYMVHSVYIDDKRIFKRLSSKEIRAIIEQRGTHKITVRMKTGEAVVFTDKIRWFVV